MQKFIKLFALISSMFMLVSCGGNIDNTALNSSSLNVQTGHYNAAVENSSCILTDASGATYSATTYANGLTSFTNITSLPKGLTTMTCDSGTKGRYISEADGTTILEAPTQNAATIYSGSGDLIIVVSPLSNIAYNFAQASGDLNSIDGKNKAIAEKFGLSGTNVTTIIPKDLNDGAITGSTDEDIVGMILAKLAVLDGTATGSAGTASASVNTLAALDTLANQIVNVTAGSFTGDANTRASSSTTTVSTKTVSAAVAPVITGTASVNVGATTQLSVGTSTVVWKSDNTAVATVNTSGLVTGVSSGGANIIATNTDLTANSSTFAITVVGSTAPATTQVATINITSANSATAGTTLGLTANVSPTDATTKTLTWSILSGSGATISGSTLSANAAGSVVVQAQATDGSGVVATQAFTVNAATTTPATIGTATATSNSSTASITLDLDNGVHGTVSASSFGIETNATNTLTITNIDTVNDADTSITLNLSRAIVDDGGDTTGASKFTGEAITITFTADVANNIEAHTGISVDTSGVAYNEECSQCILDADGCPF